MGKVEEFYLRDEYLAMTSTASAVGPMVSCLYSFRSLGRLTLLPLYKS